MVEDAGDGPVARGSELIQGVEWDQLSGLDTVAEETLKELADERGKQVKTYLYGQEINPETYAICKADMLLKGEGENADHTRGDPAAARGGGGAGANLGVGIIHGDRPRVVEPGTLPSFIMRDPLKANLCSKYLRAVAEPERLRIVQCLRGGAKSVGDIARHLNSPVVNASHHLKHLRRAGLVVTTKQGRYVFYALAPRFAPRGNGRSLDVLDFGCCRIELAQ
jgi:hypothetical protein